MVTLDTEHWQADTPGAARGGGADSRVVAIGELGLIVSATNLDEQLAMPVPQLDLAEELGLPGSFTAAMQQSRCWLCWSNADQPATAFKG